MADEPGESDLRKRAAWLLAMLALVAVLMVVVFTTLLKSDNSGNANNQAGPDDTVAPSQVSTSSRAHSSPTVPSSGSSTTGSATASCPTPSACALPADVGNAVAAINAYRRDHNQQAVPGSVSAQAKKCALGNGLGCTGGYAESQVTKPTGAAAVAKISKLGKLLDPSMKSFEVGWAYDPQNKTYFFAVIRND